MNLQFNSEPQVSGYGMSPEALMGGNGLFRRAIAFNADAGAEGGVTVTPDPVPPPQDQQVDDPIAGLKSALEKERQRGNTEEKTRKDLERQFKQLQESVKGIDPEKYKQFEALQAQAEEWNKKEVELRNLLEQDFRNQIVSEQEKVKQAESKYNDLLLRTAAEKAYQLAGGRLDGGDDGVSFFDLFYSAQKGKLKYNDQSGNLEVVDGNGVKMFSKKDSSKPMSAQEYFQSLITHKVFGHYFAPDPNRRGSGTPPGSASNTPNPYIGNLNDLPRAERLTRIRESQGRI